MNNIKAVLFDMDGVLIDAKEWHYEALNQALALFGYTITREEHEGYYDGLPTRIKLQKLTKEKGLPETLHEFINTMKQKYTVDAIYNNSVPDFSKQILMKKLKKMGIKTACCSNSIRNSIILMLEKGMILEHFDLIVSADDVKKSKPNPEMYITAMEKLGVSPNETIIVEDSPHGIEAANATGAHVIIVENATKLHSGVFKDYIIL